MLTLSRALNTQGWHSVAVDLTVSDLDDGKGIGMEATSKDGGGSTTTKRKNLNDMELSAQTSESPASGERTIMPPLSFNSLAPNLSPSMCSTPGLMAAGQGQANIFDRTCSKLYRNKLSIGLPTRYSMTMLFRSRSFASRRHNGR